MAAVIVARLSRADVAGLIPHEQEVDVSALRDELAVRENRKRGAAQMFARGTIDQDQLETISAELDQARESAPRSSAPSSRYSFTNCSMRLPAASAATALLLDLDDDGASWTRASTNLCGVRTLQSIWNTDAQTGYQPPDRTVAAVLPGGWPGRLHSRAGGPARAT